MSSIINIENYLQHQPVAPAPQLIRDSDRGTAATTPRAPMHAVDVDTVQFSDVGRSLSAAMAESSFRIARVAAVREEIDRGTYETSQRIEGTVDRLLDVLG